MLDRNRLERYQLVVVLGLLLFTPVVLLVVTVGFLLAAQSIVLADLSPLEVVELYLIELVFFVAFAYLLYRVTSVTVTEHLPGGGSEDDDETRPGDDTP